MTDVLRGTIKRVSNTIKKLNEIDDTFESIEYIHLSPKVYHAPALNSSFDNNEDIDYKWDLGNADWIGEDFPLEPTEEFYIPFINLGLDENYWMTIMYFGRAEYLRLKESLPHVATKLLPAEGEYGYEDIWEGVNIVMECGLGPHGETQVNLEDILYHNITQDSALLSRILETKIFYQLCKYSRSNVSSEVGHWSMDHLHEPFDYIDFRRDYAPREKSGEGVK